MVKGLYAVAAISAGLLGCTPLPTLSPPAKIASAPCQQANKCTVQIYFDAQGNPSADIDEIVVGRANSHLWWVLLDKGCSFVASTGVLLKDPNGDPRGQFDEKYVADDNEQQLQLGQHGARYHWRDKYLVMGSTQYELNFTCNGRSFHIDPSIKNGN